MKIDEFFKFNIRHTAVTYSLPTLNIYGLLNSAAKKISFILFLIYTISSLDDINVALLDVPEFTQLNLSEGVIGFDSATKWGRLLTLKHNGKTITFNCHTYHAEDCLPESNEPLYANKKARVWWYNARFAFGHRKRLLQLEVNNKIIIGYKEQKEKYFKTKAGHWYLSSWFSFLMLAWFFCLQLIDNRKFFKRI